jgi:hypothetical protein
VTIWLQIILFIAPYDLQDFFTSVRASRVHALFETLGYAETVARELTALCTTATPEPVLRRMHEQSGLTWTQLQRLRDPHLPQGAPTSAALANLCAFRLDLRLDGLAHTLGARYTRYADDIVLSGGNHLSETMSRIEAWIGRIAIEEGFALNHRKTRCLNGSSRAMLWSPRGGATGSSRARAAATSQARAPPALGPRGERLPRGVSPQVPPPRAAASPSPVSVFNH